MRKKEQEALIEALAYCSLRGLPEPDNNDGYWLEALARVVKQDGSVSYAYVKRDKSTLEPIIKKVFGGMGGIALVDQYYPFEYLRDEFYPTLEKKDDKVKYLSELYPENSKEYTKMNVKALDNEIIKTGIALQDDFDNKLVYNG